MKSITGFGSDYELQISANRAREILKPHPLPGIGHETTVKGSKDEFGFRTQLVVQNISGTYVLASSSYPKSLWDEQHGVGLCANSEAAILRMVAVKNAERYPSRN